MAFIVGLLEQPVHHARVHVKVTSKPHDDALPPGRASSKGVASSHATHGGMPELPPYLQEPGDGTSLDIPEEQTLEELQRSEQEGQHSTKSHNNNKGGVDEGLLEANNSEQLHHNGYDSPLSPDEEENDQDTSATVLLTHDVKIRIAEHLQVYFFALSEKSFPLWH